MPGRSKSAVERFLLAEFASERTDSKTRASIPVELTTEQASIVASQADFLRVTAFAGTGKTSTLVAFAKARPQVRMLYVAFNKAVQMEAERKFPSNVVCRTTHALAFASDGKHYTSKLVNGRLRPLTILQVLALPRNQKRSYRLAGHVQRVLLEYLASDKETIAESFPVTAQMTEKHLAVRERLIKAASVLWDRMRDLNDNDVGMLHDGYLKLFQLRKPRLPFDHILFDEAQDANPVTTSIIASQDCRKVFVGDRHQQIYTFRGAVDAMRRADFTESLYLTHSFRFRSNVAQAANVILQLKGEPERVKGIRSRSASSTKAYITRGNAALFDRAAELVKASQSPCFIGGIEGYELNLVRDTFWLYKKERTAIKSTFIRQFDSFDDLAGYASSLQERDLIAWVKVVRKHAHEMPQLIDLIIDRHEPDPLQADLCLMTAHKSKGLEFGAVKMGPDFPPCTFLANGEVVGEEEELNLLYVTATRAEEKLETNGVFDTLTKHLKKFPGAHWRAPDAPYATPAIAPEADPSGSSSDRRLAPGDILALLAAGRDPWSGAPLGQEQIVLRPEVKQALNAALTKGGAAAKPGRTNGSYQPWAPEEDLRLRQEHQAGQSIARMAQSHGRTEGAIRSRLQKLNLMN